MQPRKITLDGKVFTQRPDKYFRSSDKTYLHRYIWEKHNGLIPEGYCVHHKDGDRENNSADNLEVLSVRKHSLEHWETRKRIRHKCRTCQKTYWAFTTAGSIFCGNTCYAKARRASGVDDITRTCEHCKEPFRINKYKKSKYCGSPCAGEARRKR